MSNEPEPTPDEEPVEAEVPKTGAEAWKARRALILDRNAAAHERGKAVSDRASNRVADQRRLNAEREAAQQRSMNAHLTKKRPRG